MQVTLVGETGGGGDVGDGGAGFEESARRADAVGKLHGVRRQSEVLAEEADEPELPDTCDGGELVEADVALRLVREVLGGQAQCPVIARAQGRVPRPAAGGAVDQDTDPFGKSLILFEPRGVRRLERAVHPHEIAGEFRIGHSWFGERDAGGEWYLVVPGQRGQVHRLDSHQAGEPGLAVNGDAGVRSGRIPGDELARLDEPALPGVDTADDLRRAEAHWHAYQGQV